MHQFNSIVCYLGPDVWLFYSLTPCYIVAVQLLQKLSISAAGKRDKLFRVIKNPVTQYLPVDSRKIGEVALKWRSCLIIVVDHPLFYSPPAQSVTFGGSFIRLFIQLRKIG